MKKIIVGILSVLVVVVAVLFIQDKKLNQSLPENEVTRQYENVYKNPEFSFRVEAPESYEMVLLTPEEDSNDIEERLELVSKKYANNLSVSVIPASGYRYEDGITGVVYALSKSLSEWEMSAPFEDSLQYAECPNESSVGKGLYPAYKFIFGDAGVHSDKFILVSPSADRLFIIKNNSSEDGTDRRELGDEAIKAFLNSFEITNQDVKISSLVCDPAKAKLR